MHDLFSKTADKALTWNCRLQRIILIPAYQKGRGGYIRRRIEDASTTDPLMHEDDRRTLNYRSLPLIRQKQLDWQVATTNTTLYWKNEYRAAQPGWWCNNLFTYVLEANIRLQRRIETAPGPKHMHMC
jgi:hypothetical protein